IWVNDELPMSVKRLSLNPAGRSLNDATRLPPKQRSDRATLLILVCCLHFPRSAQREPSTTGTDVTGETYVNFVAMTRPSSDESSRVTPVVRLSRFLHVLTVRISTMLIFSEVVNGETCPPTCEDPPRLVCAHARPDRVRRRRLGVR